jgi:hypothetical protein
MTSKLTYLTVMLDLMKFAGYEYGRTRSRTQKEIDPTVAINRLEQYLETLKKIPEVNSDLNLNITHVPAGYQKIDPILRSIKCPGTNCPLKLKCDNYESWGLMIPEYRDEHNKCKNFEEIK